MIKLGRMKWSNCFSYGNANEFDFSKEALVQLVGKNGHGKSSIPLILEEVLYNKNSKGIKKADILNRYTKDKSYSIELHFSKDGAAYSISTTRGSTQTVKLYKDGVDVSSHTSTGTYKMIEELFGMDHKTFSQIVYQSSVSSLEFLTATDTARKKFLIELLNLGIYTQANEVFKEAAGLVSKEVDKLNAKKETIASWIAKFNATELVELALEDEPSEPTSLRVKSAELQIELANIASINKKRTTNNFYGEQLDSTILDETPYCPQPDKLSRLEAELSSANSIEKTSKSLISKYANLSDTCPTCKQHVDNHSIKEMCATAGLNVESAQASKVLIEAEISLLRKDILGYKASQELLSQWEKYHALYDTTLPSELLVAANIQADISRITSEVSAVEKAIKSARDNNTKALNHNTKIKVLQEQEASMRIDLAEIEEQLDYSVGKLTTLQVLTKTFSTTGLVAYKIECLVKDLEDLTNEYLAELYEGRFQLSFQVSSSDKLNVVITDNGRDIDILALSSGERARVNVATLLAIRKLMQSLSNSRINLLVLDETVESLDAEGKEKLVEVLLGEENLNTVLVSHGYQHPLIERVTVLKDNNISRIE